MEQAPEAWLSALRTYCYPVVLSRYEGRERFPNHFKQVISGDRDSTVAFENYFRKNASHSIEVYFEVVFWKLYYFKDQRVASTIIEGINAKPASLFSAITKFVESPLIQIENLKNIRRLLALKVEDGRLAVALTFPAFVNPERFSIVDTHVADWVNRNLESHSKGRIVELTRFDSRPKPLTDNDFQSYVNWVLWCRETAAVLSKKTSIAWRARDVEMAVFSAEKRGLKLEAP